MRKVLRILYTYAVLITKIKMNSALTSKEIRDTFIKYFVEEKKHEYVHSSSVIPHEDPTLLFANAGMNQFKPIFLGTVDPNSNLSRLTRAVNTQKCIRAGGKHNDLDDVGKDVYHHTFFEMLGNWGFGDYFKKEICTWAWDLLTRVFQLPKDQLYVTYFGGNKEAGLDPDLECKQIWLDLGLEESRIIPGSMKDNFWEMGETGPCGPCSEIHFDRIGNRKVPELVNQDDPDVLEVWNLVFIQYNRESSGELKFLPKKHIDCGLGFERLVSVIQNKRSNYDTDLFTPIFDRIFETSGVKVKYGGKVGAEDVNGIDMAYRVIADHIRTLTIAMSDGGRPENTGRGYVLRRILRRAVRFSTEKLNAEPGFFAALVDTVVDILGDVFPEIRKDPQTIKDVINEEEAQFLKTLKTGQYLLKRTMEKMDPAVNSIFPGDIAWKLYDTYGFPIDLTQLMVEEKGFSIDMAAYEKARKIALELSQGKGNAVVDECKLDVHAIEQLKSDNIPLTDDSPKYNYKATTDSKDGAYEFEKCEAKVVAIRCGNKFVSEAKEGEQCCLILDKTCFYAEQGGQIYDQGFITANGTYGSETYSELIVDKVIIQGGYILHIGKITAGVFTRGGQVALNYDTKRRRLIMNNHTGTHILNHALREVLGPDSQQKGSLVAPDRLRFDFSCKAAMTVDQIRKAEKIVQDIIKRNGVVYTKLCQLEEAKKICGLRAMFDETYPDPVRVVSVGEPVENLEHDPLSKASLLTSVEFCGGTHVHRSGHIEEFLITSEEAISKGIRRIIAITGPDAEKALRRTGALKAQLEELIKLEKESNDSKALSKKWVELNDEVSHSLISTGSKDELRKKLNELKKKVDTKEKNAQNVENAKIVQVASDLLNQVNGELFLVEKLQAGANTKAVDMSLKHIMKLNKDLSVMFFTVDQTSGRISCLCAVSPVGIQNGLSGDDWIKTVIPVIKGKGGGKKQSGQASGSNYAAIDEAISVAKKYASEHFKTTAKENTPLSSSSDGAPQGLYSYNDLVNARNKIAEKFAARDEVFGDDELEFFGNGSSYYVANVNLKAPGNVSFNSAKVIEWLNYSDSTVWPVVNTTLKKGKSSEELLQPIFKYLNDTLKDKTFLVGDRISLADVSLCTALYPISTKLKSLKNKYIHVFRWFNTLINHPHVHSVIS
ncbi:alanine--tRNA ligase, cytoplasmic [Planococcus citri]|uniref:alanine--tRNA ligase, cytoplasmic n=1 Tax=Planococcus citri TaxID=170843 RepID=UPI0031F9F06B